MLFRVTVTIITPLSSGVDPSALAGFDVEANFDLKRKAGTTLIVLRDRNATLPMPPVGDGREFLKIAERVTPCSVPDLLAALGHEYEDIACSVLLQAAAHELAYLKVPSGL